MRYTIARNGQVLGTYSEEEIRGYLQAGRLVATDHVLPEGGAMWTPLGQSSFLAAAGGEKVNPPAASATAPAAAPKTYLGLAIAGTVLSVFACSIFVTPIGLATGIIGIVFATQVSGKHAAGDHAGAASMSKNALILSWISVGVGVLGVLLMFGMMAVVLLTKGLKL